ncbi:hypothetical protein [Streptomyces chrestomyceticus]|uniref:hypothetical protein n=1 Tax=Streptomyces chrestomyceticus TaxID=68185 RepID=UPI0034081D5E
MECIHLDAQVGDLSGVLSPARNLERLPLPADELPAGARGFATAPGHDDPSGKRCVKDLELQHMRGAGADGQEVEIRSRHNCWKHDEDLVICSSDVPGFHAGSTEGDDRGDCQDDWEGLGTVIFDEILPHRDGCSHEIAFWDGSLTVVCRGPWRDLDRDRLPRQSVSQEEATATRCA